MNRKKLVLVVFAVLMCITFIMAITACSSSQNPSTDNQTPEEKTCEHEWVKESTVSGTCITYGYTNFVCSICGETQKIQNKKYEPHTYANHLCTVCGARQDGTQMWESGGTKVYLYNYGSTILGEEAYTITVCSNGSGISANYTKGNQPWASVINSIKKIEIIDGVKEIGDSLFEGCFELNEITIADSVTSIGENAFANCELLEKIKFSESLVSVGKHAFFECSALKEALMPATAVSIAECAFEGCTNIKNMSIARVGADCAGDKNRIFGAIFGEANLQTDAIGQAVTVNGIEYKFKVPKSLRNLEIKGDANIPGYAFYACTTLETIVVSGKVEEIGQEAFSCMTELGIITFTQNTLLKIGAYAFSGDNNLGSPADVLINDKTQIVERPLILPNSVLEIGENAFSSCTGLTKVILSGEGLKEIPRYCFGLCSKLSEIVLPESIEIIRDEAFIYTGLEEIKLGKNVYFIGMDAFKSCSKLNKIYIDSVNVYMTASDDKSKLFYFAWSVYVLKSVVPEGTEKDSGTGYIKTHLQYKGLDQNGYHLWEK